MSGSKVVYRLTKKVSAVKSVPIIYYDVMEPPRPTPADFDSFVPWACRQFEILIPIVVTRVAQGQYVSSFVKEKLKQRRNGKLKPLLSSDSVQGPSFKTNGSKVASEDVENDKSIQLEAIYDENLNLVRIQIETSTKIPRLLFKVIGLAIPYHKAFASIIISGGLRAGAIHDISNYYRTSRITEICLDNTYLSEANYHILLDNDTIMHLSLSKCYINDDVVETIASKLFLSCPAANSLSALNLSMNNITDDGVKYLATMLRSNRRLSYLNLANNRITDVGAVSIFDTLTEFMLTETEVTETNKRLFSYVKAKNELIAKMLVELHSGDYGKQFVKKKSHRSPHSRKKSDGWKELTSSEMLSAIEANIAEKAVLIAEETMGSFSDPFSAEHTKYEDTECVCYGNNTLSYLNLAFNNLSYISIKKLYEVVKKQNYLDRKPKGLINIRVEGNYLPENCKEYQLIDELLFSGLGLKKKAGRSF